MALVAFVLAGCGAPTPNPGGSGSPSPSPSESAGDSLGPIEVTPPTVRFPGTCDDILSQEFLAQTWSGGGAMALQPQTATVTTIEAAAALQSGAMTCSWASPIVQGLGYSMWTLTLTITPDRASEYQDFYDRRIFSDYDTRDTAGDSSIISCAGYGGCTLDMLADGRWFTGYLTWPYIILPIDEMAITEGTAELQEVARNSAAAGADLPAFSYPDEVFQDWPDCVAGGALEAAVRETAGTSLSVVVYDDVPSGVYGDGWACHFSDGGFEGGVTMNGLTGGQWALQQIYDAAPTQWTAIEVEGANTAIVNNAAEGYGLALIEVHGSLVRIATSASEATLTSQLAAFAAAITG
jgi:hypothetical protein